MESAFIKITLVKRHSTDAERSGYKVPWGESNKVQSFKELDICPESKHTKGSHRRQQYGNCAKFQGKTGVRTFGKLPLTSQCCVQEFPRRSTTRITRIRRAIGSAISIDDNQSAEHL